jgi:3-hydroxybutyryl-CoA dehydratase
MLTASLYSQLLGVCLPGKFVLLHGIDINSTCRAGGPLHVAGEVAFVSEALKRVEIKASIRRGDRKLVSKATMRVGFHVD